MLWRRYDFLFGSRIRVGSLRINALVPSFGRLDYALVFRRRVRLVLVVGTRRVLTLRNRLLLHLGGIGRSRECYVTLRRHERECRQHDSGCVELLHRTKPLPGHVALHAV
jgi:hypothetical protein